MPVVEERDAVEVCADHASAAAPLPAPQETACGYCILFCTVCTVCECSQRTYPGGGRKKALLHITELWRNT